MCKTFLIAALACLGWSGMAAADVLAMPEEADEPTVQVPARGASMATVMKQFGEPKQRHPAVGGGAPQRPPITRWDYDRFSVIFEKDKVIDAVVAGKPAPVRRTDELQRSEPAAEPNP